MTDTEILQLVKEETELKTWGYTEQFLNIHSLVYNANHPIIERIDREKRNGIVVAYLPVKDEQFYLAIQIQTDPKPEITGIHSESYCDVSFRAFSEMLSFKQLDAMTILTVTDGWNKGDVRRTGKMIYANSRINITPNPEPDEFEDKLNKLLNYLEQDIAGIKQLAAIANGYIQVAMVIHNGNTMLGGPHLSRDAIKRISALNLEIDFDLYAEGKFYQ